MTLREAKQLKSGDIILSNDKRTEYVIAGCKLNGMYLNWNITKNFNETWVYGQYIDRLHVKKISQQLFKIY